MFSTIWYLVVALHTYHRFEIFLHGNPLKCCASVIFAIEYYYHCNTIHFFAESSNDLSMEFVELDKQQQDITNFNPSMVFDPPSISCNLLFQCWPQIVCMEFLGSCLTQCFNCSLEGLKSNMCWFA